MSEHTSKNERGDENESELPWGVSVNQGVLTTPLGSWPISRIGEVTIHRRPIWLTMIIAVVAGAIMTQLWVLANHGDPMSFKANLIYTLTMAYVIGAGKIRVKVRSEGIHTTVWEETWMLFGTIHSDKGSANRVHELISKALSTKAS